MSRRTIPLEDTWIDVLHKARLGLGLSEKDLAARTDLPEVKISALLSGVSDPDRLARVAEAMGLDAPRLLALERGDYHPGEIVLPEGMEMFSTDWDGMQVHSYLAWDRATKEAVAFDTGADADGMLSFLAEHGLALRLILLTHGHGDHLFDLDRLAGRTGAHPWICEREEVPGIASFAPGKEFRTGRLRIETRLTRGHAAGGITYVIHGLGRPVAVVGDAMFAGSMGGARISYEASLETNRKEILSLPPETILCPGHGPLTTVALERTHNPFFPDPEQGLAHGSGA